MEQKHKKILLWSLAGAVALVVLLLFLLPQIQFPETSYPVKSLAENIPLKVGYKATSHYLSVMVAKEKGYFAEEGLDAELVKFDSSNQVMDGVLAGNLDVGRGGLVLQLEVEEKQPGAVKTILVNTQTKENYIDYILVRKDSPVKFLSELKGTIGTNTGAVEKIHLSLVLKKLGIADNLKIVEMKPDLLPAALESKQVDAIFTYEPIINVALKKGIARILESAPIEKYLYDPWIGGGVFVKSSLIKENPEAAKKIFRAFYKAGKFIEQHPEEAKQVLLKYTPIDAEVIKGLHALPEYSPFEYPLLVEKAQENADMLYKEGYLKQKVEVSKMLVDLR